MEGIVQSQAQRSTDSAPADYPRLRPNFWTDNRSSVWLLCDFARRGYLSRPPMTISFIDGLGTNLWGLYNGGTHEVTVSAAVWTRLTPRARYDAILHGGAHHLLDHSGATCYTHRGGLKGPRRAMATAAHQLAGQLGCVPGLPAILARLGILSDADAAWLATVFPKLGAPAWQVLPQETTPLADVLEAALC